MINKRTREEQIKLILNERTFELAAELPDPNNQMSELQFSDFIDATFQDCVDFVNINGFPGSNVAEEGTSQRFHGDNQYRIESSCGKWIVFFSERGQKSDEEKFDTLIEARIALVKKLFQSAEISLNHCYLNAHSKLICDTTLD